MLASYMAYEGAAAAQVLATDVAYGSSPMTRILHHNLESVSVQL